MSELDKNEADQGTSEKTPAITEGEIVPILARIFRRPEIIIRKILKAEPMTNFLEREAIYPTDCARLFYARRDEYLGEGLNIAVRHAKMLIEKKEEAALALVREVMAPDETGT